MSGGGNEIEAGLDIDIQDGSEKAESGVCLCYCVVPKLIVS